MSSAIVELLSAGGHRVAGRGLVKDDAREVRAIVEAALGQPDVQVVITTGGTGISSRDATFELAAAEWKRAKKLRIPGTPYYSDGSKIVDPAKAAALIDAL